MANDWIKMRVDLQTHPKVFRIMSALNADICTHDVRVLSDKYRIIGALHAVWCLFDAHSEDGVLVGYSAEILDSSLGIPGLSRAMEGVGWLIVESCGAIKMPEFDTHNGSSAKRRAKETDRKRKERLSANCPQVVQELSACDADKMRTREEKRRDIKNTPLPPKGDDSTKPKKKRTPKDPDAYTPEFEKAWAAYPRKDGKRKAFEAWQKATKRDMPVDDMPEHIESRSFEQDWRKDEGRFIPHMATWLNRDGWLDDGAKITPRKAEEEGDFWDVGFYHDAPEEMPKPGEVLS